MNEQGPLHSAICYRTFLIGSPSIAPRAQPRDLQLNAIVSCQVIKRLLDHEVGKLFGTGHNRPVSSSAGF
jgi:hypothetical protein